MKKMVSLLLMCILLFSSCGNESNYNSSVGSETPIASSQPEISSTIEALKNGELSTSQNTAIISLELLQQNAFVLTKHLLSSVEDYNIEGKDTFISKNERQIQNFIYTTALFEDYPNNLYSDVVIKKNVSKFESEIAYRYIFNKEKLERMLYEVFSISNWNFDNLNMEFDSQNNTYVTGLEFEFGIICDVDDEMEYRFEGNTLEVIAKVSYYGKSDENGDPAFGSYQKKRFLYQVCVEGERTYLRLLKETDSI